MLGRTGAALHERARGRDSRVVEEREVPQSISRETTLAAATSDLAELEGMLAYLVDRAMRAVRDLGLKTRRLRVRLRYSDWADEEGSAALAPTAFDEDVQPAARALLRSLYRRRVALRFVGVTLSGFSDDGGQLQLFGDGRLERFHAAADAVREKFGHGALVTGRAIALLGTLPKDAHGYVLRTPCLTK
jgi:DNA polymerase-4